VPYLIDNDPLKMLCSVTKWRKQIDGALMSIVMGLLAKQKERIFFFTIWATSDFWRRDVLVEPHG